MAIIVVSGLSLLYIETYEVKVKEKILDGIFKWVIFILLVLGTGNNSWLSWIASKLQVEGIWLVIKSIVIVFCLNILVSHILGKFKENIYCKKIIRLSLISYILTIVVIYCSYRMIFSQVMFIIMIIPILISLGEAIIFNYNFYLFNTAFSIFIAIYFFTSLKLESKSMDIYFVFNLSLLVTEFIIDVIKNILNKAKKEEKHKLVAVLKTTAFGGVVSVVISMGWIILEILKR